MKLATELHPYSSDTWLTKYQAEYYLKQFSINRSVTLKMCRECKIELSGQGYINKTSLEQYIRRYQSEWAEAEGIPQGPYFLPQPALRNFILITITDGRVDHEQCWITAIDNNFPYELRNFIAFLLRDDFEELTIKLSSTRYLIYRGTLEPGWVGELRTQPLDTIGPEDIDEDLRRILYPENEEGAFIL